jgi:transposase
MRLKWGQTPLNKYGKNGVSDLTFSSISAEAVCLALPRTQRWAPPHLVVSDPIFHAQAALIPLPFVPLPLPEDAARQILAHLRVRATLDGEIAALEAHLTDRLAKREDVRLLKTVPGIGAILAATIALEVGNISRFANAGCFASYCRVVASTRISNGKVKGHGQSRNAATVIWLGRSWRRRCLRNAGRRRRKAFIANAWPNATSSSH